MGRSVNDGGYVMSKRVAFRGVLLFGLVLAVLVAACCFGCATRRASLHDGQGGSMVVNDLVLMSKRDLATATGNYERRADGTGVWTIGDTSQNDDSTAIIEKLPDLFKFLGQVFAAYLQYSSTSAVTGTPSTSTVEQVALSPLMR